MNHGCETMSYLIVDGALAKRTFGSNEEEYAIPAWVQPVFKGHGALMGPLVIDVEDAVAGGRVEEMMKIANAISPQLHLSIIETSLPLAELVGHLHKFSVVKTECGQLFNVRFSDCVALSMLEKVLLPAQWGGLLSQIGRWCVHDRDGYLRELKCAGFVEQPVPTPLTFSPDQLKQLAELTEPDVMLANIQEIRHGEALPGTTSEQYQWAVQAQHCWLHSKCEDRLILRWLTSSAVNTRGAVFARDGLSALLATGDREQIRAALAA